MNFYERFLELERKLDDVFSCFRNLRIAVLGDVMLDHYVVGEATRISPEAPVPVVRIDNEFDRAGGAANVARNIKSLGGNVFLIGVMGADSEGERLKKTLEDIDCFLIRDATRPTTFKARVIADGQHIVRFDKESTAPIPEDVRRKVLETFASKEFDFVVLSDYAKGFFTRQLVEGIFSLAKGVKILCDPKVVNAKIFKGTDFMVPNSVEAGNILADFGEKFDTETDDGIKEVAFRLKELFSLEGVVITRGGKGMVVLSESGLIFIPALARSVYDVTGAGDTVSAALSLCLASGMSPEDSAVFASVAASAKVAHLGTYDVEPEDMKLVLRTL